MDLTNMLLMGAAGGEMPRGESTYAIPGTYSWTCPAGVTSVSVVAVGGGGATNGGGGGLGYKNSISVTPGTSYTVVVGAGGMAWASAAPNQGSRDGGQSYFISAATVRGGGGFQNGAGGTYTGDGGGNGGAGNYGGGGAGGYAGNGGSASNFSGSGQAGSGGGGGAGYEGNRSAGGGVGLFGQGSNGAGATGSFDTGTGATGGSGGGNAFRQCPSGSSSYQYAGKAPTFGGGGAYQATVSQGGGAHGGDGAVRIIWPGATRTFPSTDVGTP